MGSFGPLEASRGQIKQTMVGIKAVYGILEQVGSIQRTQTVSVQQRLFDLHTSRHLAVVSCIVIHSHTSGVNPGKPQFIEMSHWEHPKNLIGAHLGLWRPLKTSMPTQTGNGAKHHSRQTPQSPSAAGVPSAAGATRRRRYAAQALRRRLQAL